MRGLKAAISNLQTPRFNLGGCVLYLPLWRPDMVARGGYIASGTGTMAVTPLTLAVGANTVTALTAGTFIVTMPEGGTVASNGATITGSPVTIPAGIATSVTTGVTTGTFTCTPGNIIRSKDTNNQACTVTGAIWTPQGRSFDGDDVIACGNLTALNGVTALTFEAWMKTTGAGSPALVVSKYTDADNRCHMGSFGTDFYCNVSNGAAAYGATTITKNIWYHAAMVFDGSQATNATRLRFFKTGVEIALSYTGRVPATTPVGAFTLGAQSTSYGIGIIGEARAYIRALTAEIQNLYLATKWRYT